MSEDAAVVLAAGKGTRMRSSLPKVLQLLAGKSMLERVLDGLEVAGFPHPTVLVGYGSDLVKAAIGDRCDYVLKPRLLGTGDAARVELASLPGSLERVLVIHGDEPMIPPRIYSQMLILQ